MSMAGARGRVVAVMGLLGILVLLGLLVALGFWQLQRGAEKARILQAIETRVVEPPLEVAATPLDPAAFEYYRAQASGAWDAGQTILIDNQILDGRPGYHVITPLKLSGSETRLLVNRGWIPWPERRSIVPRPETATGAVRVHGILKLPPDDFYTLETRPPRIGDPVWQNLDMAAFGTQAGYPVQPMVLLLDADADGGFSRRWPTVKDEWVARHRGYALQWFGLALALLVLTTVVVWRSRGIGNTPGDRADD